MKQSTFGRIMTRYREKYRLQQKVICAGICSEASYLRAEVEMREGNFVVQETLLARVGQAAINFELMLDDGEFEVWTERLAIRSAMAGKQMDVVKTKVEKYRRKNASKHKLHEQFCLYYEMKLAQWECGNLEDICQIAEKALLLTKGIDEIPDNRNNLYTPMELDLLLTLVQYRYGEWRNQWKIRECLMKIIDYVDVYYSAERQENIEGRAWIELLKLEEKYGESEQLLEYIDRAITCFRNGSGILRLAEVHFIKAKFLHRLLIEGNGVEDLLKLCQEECQMAYNIYDVMERKREKEEVIHFCEEELKWHITMQTKWLS